MVEQANGFDLLVSLFTTFISLMFIFVSDVRVSDIDTSPSFSCKEFQCDKNTVKRVFPITKWLPQYTLMYLLKDFIAGMTVGLTAIPQGIAYAVVAGLDPKVCQVL